MPGGAIAGVFLTEGELAMATNCGPRRVLNRLGKAARYYPTPYWSAPARESVYSVQDSQTSLLSKFPRIAVSAGSATLCGSAMHLQLPQAFAPILADRIEGRTVSAIMPGREPGVAAALVWTPGQTEPEAIFADGSKPAAFAAAFVALIPNDAQQDDVRFMEDGYVVMLSQESAEALTRALRAGQKFEVRGGTQNRAVIFNVLRSN
jgi:hypothetical protein